MQCPKCAGQVPAGAHFCPQCGGQVNGGGAAPVAGGRAPGYDPAATPAASTGGPAAAGLRRAPIPDTPEVTLWESGISPTAMLGGWIGGAIATVLLVGVSFLFHHLLGSYWWVPLAIAAVVDALLALQFIVIRMSVHYRLTNQRLFQQRGILRRVTSRVEVIDIEDVSFEQTLLGRMLDFGRIKIVSSDKSDPILWLEGVMRVEEVFSMIDKARRQERLRRGVSVESL